MLTEKQKTFCEIYVKIGNQRAAYEQAGYKCTSRTAAREATRMMKKPEISAYIEELTVKKHDKLIAGADEILKFYTAVMRGEAKDAFGLDVSMQDRLKAADALAKRYQMFSNKVELETNTTPIKIVNDLDG